VRRVFINLQPINLDGKQVAEALLDQASDPSFFNLTENGDDENADGID